MIALYILLGLIVLLAAARFTLPFIALGLANKAINKTEGMKGNIKSISLDLAEGVIKVKHLELFKRDDRSGVYATSVKIEAIEIRIPLRKLIRKKFEGVINIIRPEIIKASVLETPKEKTNKKDVPSPAVVSPLRTTLEKIPFIKLDINILYGSIRYINHSAKPKMDLTASSINVQVEQFSNQASFDTAFINASANVYGGLMITEMTLKPMRQQLTFDLKLELKDADMVQLNPYFRTFANVDVNAGTFGLYVEINAEQGAFKGYMKPILKDIDIVGKEDSEDSIFKRLWERGVAMLFQLLQNDRTDQVATKIEFEGRLDDPHVHVGAAIAGVLRNAFIRAIKPSFETTFNFESVYKTTKGFIGKLFGRDN